jgi:hypothetical protein
MERWLPALCIVPAAPPTRLVGVRVVHDRLLAVQVQDIRGEPWHRFRSITIRMSASPSDFLDLVVAERTDVAIDMPSRFRLEASHAHQGKRNRAPGSVNLFLQGYLQAAQVD